MRTPIYRMQKTVQCRVALVQRPFGPTMVSAGMSCNHTLLVLSCFPVHGQQAARPKLRVFDYFGMHMMQFLFFPLRNDENTIDDATWRQTGMASSGLNKTAPLRH